MTQQSMQGTDRLDRALAALDRAEHARLTASGIADALDAVGEQIMSYPVLAERRRTARRRFAVRRVIAVAVLLALVGGVAAAATMVFVPTRTHTYTPRWAISGGGPGEMLNVRGTDFRQIALGLSAGIPYPSGYGSWRRYVVQRAIEPYGCVGSGEIRGEFAMSAMCAWVIDWRHARLSGDRARASHDARVLLGALRWRAVTAWDPNPRVSVPGDSGSRHRSEFGWAIPFIAAVRHGNAAKVSRLLAAPNSQLNGNFEVYTPGFAPPPGAGPSWVNRTGSGQASASYMRYLASQGLS